MSQPYSLCMLLLIQGKLHKAAAMYARAGAQEQAIAMYRDVRMFRHDDVGLLSLVMLAMHSMLSSFNVASLVCASAVRQMHSPDSTLQRCSSRGTSAN